MRLPLPWPQSWNTTLYQSCPHTHTLQGCFLKKTPTEYFTYEAYAGFSKQFCIDDISMCFKYCSNVGPFHLRRDCRPVCVWLTCPLFMLRFVSAGYHLRSLSASVQERFFKLHSPQVLLRVAFHLFSWPTHPIQKQYQRTRGNLKFLSKACVYTGNQSLTPLNLYS